MTYAERQALRYKHRDNGIDGRCETCHYDTPIEGTDISVCTAPTYPCDVIQVLDSWEIKVSETLDCLDQINTMRVDEDDYEWLQTAEFILKAEL